MNKKKTVQRSQKKQLLKSEAEHVLNKWLEYCDTKLDWVELIGSSRDPDIVADLHSIDFAKMFSVDPEYVKLLGHIPAMTTHSKFYFGVLAASFAERINSMGSHIVNTRNCRLNHEEVSKLCALRMNRKFIEFCKKRYKNIYNDVLAEEAKKLNPISDAVSEDSDMESDEEYRDNEDVPESES